MFDRSAFVFSLLCALALGLPSPLAANGQSSAAFSGFTQPHTGFCIGPNVDAAVSCAVDACLKAGANPLQCKTVRTCTTAGWSLTVSVTHPGGYRWDEFHCGYKSQQDALRMMPFFCRESRLKMVSTCKLTSMADPEGKPVAIE
jgi:hypothetical protein